MLPNLPTIARIRCRARGWLCLLLLGSGVVCSVLAMPQAAADSEAFEVRTESGIVRGTARRAGGALFLGVPYARPPVKGLRWRSPESVRRWAGVRDASQFRSACMQSDQGDWNRAAAAHSSEDCLYLNIIVPSWPVREALPVLFWIHGGANRGGTANSAFFTEGTLPDHGVVLVSVEYRLGIFGFFAHPELSRESPHRTSGNYGLMDQMAALQWVRDNIAWFGGDPERITVGGQSAGAQDTGLLLISPARGMIHGAIAESGTPELIVMPSRKKAEETGRRFAASLRAPEGRAGLTFLRGVSSAALLQAAEAQQSETLPVQGPIVDGWIVARPPSSLFAAGEQAHVPLLIGANSVEFGSQLNLAQLREVIVRAAGPYAERGLALYGRTEESGFSRDPVYGASADQWFADVRFRCPASTMAMRQAAAGAPVFLYQFDYPIPGHEESGAGHTGELPYLFGYFPREGFLSGSYAERDRRFSRLLESYWARFLATGDPNGEGLTQWPPFAVPLQFMEFTADGHARLRAGEPRGEQCRFYRDWRGE